MNHRESKPELHVLFAENEADLRRAMAALLVQSPAWAGRAFHDDDVETLLNEAMAEAIPKFSQYDPSRPFGAWIRKFALNCLRRRPRREKRNAWVEYPAGLEDALERLRRESQENREQIEAWLAQLPRDVAQLIRLRYLQDKTIDQLVEKTKAPSKNAVRLRLTRALAKLRKVVGQDSKGT